MFDFVTNLWPGAQRAPANMPPAMLPTPPIDDPWKVSGTVPAKKQKASGKRKAKVTPRPVDGVDAVLLALISACRSTGPFKMLSVSELADAMRVSVGESSKRVAEATRDEAFAWSRRDGRRKMVGLHRVSAETWAEIISSPPARAVALYRLAAHRR
jgi:hypothetical protein